MVYAHAPVVCNDHRDMGTAPGGHDTLSLPSSLCCRRWEPSPGGCCSCAEGRGSDMAPDRSRETGLSLAGDTPLLATSAACSCSKSCMTSMSERCLVLLSDPPAHRVGPGRVLVHCNMGFGTSGRRTMRRVCCAYCSAQCRRCSLLGNKCCACILPGNKAMS